MLTRREKLRMMMGMGAWSMLARSASGKGAMKPSFVVPAGSCDCHTHVFPDPGRFPFTARRLYTPPVATVAQLRALQQALRLDRVVIVAPSVYGADMRPTLYGIEQLGPSRARGVSVFSPDTSPATMQQLDRAGMRGMRVNIETMGETDPATIAKILEQAATQARAYNWHIQVYAKLELIEAAKSAFTSLTVPVVFDHFAGAKGEGGTTQPGFATVLGMVRAGKAHVKLSAPYRAAPQDGPDYPSLLPIARALIAANPDRMLWGTDWPHPGGPTKVDLKPTDIRPPYQVDDLHTFDLLARWAPDGAIRRRMLVDNPARLYGFTR